MNIKSEPPTTETGSAGDGAGAVPLRGIIGLSLDGTSPYVIDAAENRQLCQTMGVAPAPDGSAHPTYYYIATQVGMGLTVAGLCAACGFDVFHGPMMATSGATFHRPLMTGQPYLVRGEIVSLTRKASRKLGVMDLLDYRLRLMLPDGGDVVEVRNMWVLPRGQRS